MKSFVLWLQNILVQLMKYKYLKGINFPFFFKLVNIDTKSKQVQLGITPIVTSYVIDMTPPLDLTK